MYRKCVLIIVLLVFLYLHAKKLDDSLMRNDNKMLVKYGGSDEAARLLNKANDKVLTVAEYLKKIYRIGLTDEEIAATSPIVDSQARRVAVAIVRNYNYEQLYENDPLNAENSTSFILNKKVMYVCLRHKDDPSKFVDLNLLVFVMLHEISHIGNYDGWAHGADFWAVFAFVLRAAVACGAYRATNYAKDSQMYCGMKITYDPLSDPKLKKLEGEI